MSHDGDYGEKSSKDKKAMEKLFKLLQSQDEARAKEMKTEKDAISVMFSAWQRLHDLGWRDACYCPKDGSTFYIIEPGSTGIHVAHYQGEWPKGTWWIHADNDLCPSRPILFKPIPR